MNRIIELKFSLQPDNTWLVELTKEFAHENGGGTRVFQQPARTVAHAIEVGRAMVAMSASRRTDS